MASFTIRPIEASDIPGIATAAMSAWYQLDSQWRQMWPNDSLETVIANCTLRYPHNLDRWHNKRYEVAVDNTTGEVLGTARWAVTVPDGMADNVWESAHGVNAKDEEESAKFKKMFDDAPWNPDGRYGHECSPKQNQFRDRVSDGLKEKPYLTLEFLATHPAHLRKGVATALVSSGLKEADKLNITVIVTASPAATTMYQKLGFKLFPEFRTGEGMLDKPGGSEFLLEYVMNFLVREPQVIKS